jgi:hypothetical protein
LTAILIFLGVLGFIVTTKQFERSIVHFRLSEAYLQTINALLNDDTKTLIPEEKAGQIKYIKDALGVIGFTRITEGAISSEDFVIETTNYNPVDPRGIVEPKHNKEAVYWVINFAKVNLFRVWQYIYFAFIFVGIILSIIAYFFPFNTKIS